MLGLLALQAQAQATDQKSPTTRRDVPRLKKVNFCALTIRNLSGI